ncbi:hypothetical protein ACIQBJ_16480 [Kitasatospora sp. NPDC088391]|uniref:hypothetical protein n=1 Tax=Kitasatospora sp. NPDC088391 TaxID=3364074 RepID=UPI00382DD0FE
MPWLRDELIEALEPFGKSEGPSESDFHDLLEFLDRTGAVDSPEDNAVGHFLLDAGEASVLRGLGAACDAVIDLPQTDVAVLLATDEGLRFSAEARSVRQALLRNDRPAAD